MPVAKHTLTKLQSAIYFELLEHGQLTGYDISKIIDGKDLYWSHQQVYRELPKMALKMVYVPQEGKPDKKVYSLPNETFYSHKIKDIDLLFLSAYPDQNLIDMRMSYIDDQLQALSSVPLSIINCFRIEITNLEREYLLSLKTH
ncbi:hypothetical protein [Vibrio mediterranei]|uniref:hypothetical protein n=1 Tax=Vibrio mediterranei TaxID=689 RepID=UPI003C12F9CB